MEISLNMIKEIEILNVCMNEYESNKDVSDLKI